jgi:hypothetical protein
MTFTCFRFHIGRCLESFAKLFAQMLAKSTSTLPFTYYYTMMGAFAHQQTQSHNRIIEKMLSVVCCSSGGLITSHIEGCIYAKEQKGMVI